MKTLLVLSALVLVTSLKAAEPVAAQPTTVEKTTEENANVEKNEARKPRSRNKGPVLSSYENRENLKYQITASAIGHEYVAFSPLTLSLGYYLDPDNILIARYTNYNGSRSDLWGDDTSESLRAVTLGVRHFFTNSFNIMPTVYYRRSTKEGDFSIWNNARGSLKYEDIGIGVRIGNEWQWENFTMGCDWFGINRTVHAIHDQKTGTDDWDELESDRKYTFTLASFYIGYSF